MKKQRTLIGINKLIADLRMCRWGEAEITEILKALAIARNVECIED